MKRKPLTTKQARILAFIKKYQKKHGYPPTRAEIAGHYGVYWNAITGHLGFIEKKGYIRVLPNTARGLVVL